MGLLLCASAARTYTRPITLGPRGHPGMLSCTAYCWHTGCCSYCLQPTYKSAAAIWDLCVVWARLLPVRALYLPLLPAHTQGLQHVTLTCVHPDNDNNAGRAASYSTSSRTEQPLSWYLLAYMSAATAMLLVLFCSLPGYF